MTRAGAAGGAGSRRGPRPDRLVAATHLDRADVVDLDPAQREPVRRGAEQNLARFRELLEAGGDVDGLAGRERGVAGAGHDLAGLDADPSLELELVDALEDLERSADGALRVVLVRLRNAEGGHHGVARELLDRTAVALDAARDAVEELRHAPAYDFRVARRDERRRVDEVDEQDRGEFSFHFGSKCKNDPSPRLPSLAMLDPKVFKAYDVRGIYPAEIDEDGARAIGRAYVEQFEPETDRRRARHAHLVAVDGEGGDRGRRWPPAPT